MLKTFNEALEFLYNNLPMFQRQGAVAYKKDLGNIIKLCEVLGNPQQSFQTIHVGGTNGKGSTTHMLSALMQSQGLKVGVYTSPHYKDFRERIKIGNDLIDRKFIIDFLNQYQEDINRIQPSFFEITVAIAFKYFKRKKVDVAIIEVGLGGRLDSTNIISPVVSVITNISFDHMQFLGNTLVEIAGEKAGIIKSKTPIVISENQAEVRHVFEKKASEMKAPLIYADEIYRVEFSVISSQVSVKSKDILLDLKAPWFVEYQQKNLKAALATFQIFMKSNRKIINWALLPEYLEKLPEKTYFLGRWMVLSENPKIVAESAHNEAGMKYVFDKLAREKYQTFHFVIGFSDDKDLSKVLVNFSTSAKYYYAKADIPRGKNAEELKLEAQKYGLKGKAYSSVKSALKAAKRAAGKNDFIYIGGSIFVVAEVL